MWPGRGAVVASRAAAGRDLSNNSRRLLGPDLFLPIKFYWHEASAFADTLWLSATVEELGS